MIALFFLIALWYYTFVTGAQRFSPSEQKTVFRLHVYQFNMKKNKLKEVETARDRFGLFVYLRSIYATVWNRFDKETKRISKSIDEKMDERYNRAWQYFLSFFYSSADGGAYGAVKEGLSMKSEYSSVGRRSAADNNNNQVFIAPPPVTEPTTSATVLNALK